MPPRKILIFFDFTISGKLPRRECLAGQGLRGSAAAASRCKKCGEARQGLKRPDPENGGKTGLTTEYLLNEQVERVLELLMPVNRLVMRVALHTGLRVSDVLSLRTDDLLRGPRWAITEQKTGKRRTVSLPHDLWHELQGAAGTEWVFPSRCDQAKHRSRQAVWRDIKRAQKACRLPQNIGPHSARKVYAVRLMEQYGDIEKVRKNLNHDSFSTTMIYAMADSLMRAKHKRPRRRS